MPRARTQEHELRGGRDEDSQRLRELPFPALRLMGASKGQSATASASRKAHEHPVAGRRRWTSKEKPTIFLERVSSTISVAYLIRLFVPAIASKAYRSAPQH